MINCRILLQVHSSNSCASSDDVWLETKLKIPFLPVLGMTIKVNDEIHVELIDRGRYEGGSCQITYDATKPEIVIYTEDMPNEHNEKLFKQIVRDYKKQGWKLMERQADE